MRKELSDQEGAYKWFNRGIALIKLGRYEEATAEFDRVLTVLPRYAEAWFNKGNALNRLGRYREALAAYNRVLAINPHDEKVQRMKNDLIRILKQSPG